MYVITEWFERYEVNEKCRPAKAGDKLRIGPLLYIRSKVHGHAQSAGFYAMQCIAERRAYEVFGVFQKFLEISGNSGPRTRGILLNHRGEPATVSDLAHILRESEEVIQNALEVLTATGVNWMAEIDSGKFREFQENRSPFLNTNQDNSSQVKTSQHKTTQLTLSHANHLWQEFWKAYPKKVGEAKARECFEGLLVDASLLKKMLSKIELLTKTDEWIRENGRFIPHAVKWLEREGWDDEISPNPEKKKTSKEILDDYTKALRCKKTK